MRSMADHDSILFIERQMQHVNRELLEGRLALELYGAIFDKLERIKRHIIRLEKQNG